MLEGSLKISRDEARAYILDHLRICYDTCHMAVQHDDISGTLKKYNGVGIKIGKIQVSCALKVPFAKLKRSQIKQALLSFAESTYLHQTVQENSNGTLALYKDLPDALAHISDPNIKEWRIHFHVPIFLEKLEHFYSTQEETRRVLEVFKKQQFSRHLELETYTFDVLPEKYKTNLLESIEREYKWTLKQLRIK